MGVGDGVSSEIASKATVGPKQPPEKLYSRTFTDSQPEKSIQARQSIDVTFCQPQIW